MSRRLFPALVVAAMLACPGIGRADTLDDSLQTVWESLWDQGGTARQVLRWKSPVTYRIFGPDSARHADHLRAALLAAQQATGVVMVDVSGQADAESAASLELEVVSDKALADNAPCITETRQIRNWLLEKVRMRMRSSDTWRCAFHEVMHAMGIPGHPSGKTVLSYFPYRNDVLMDLDRLMLAAWYSPRLTPGATPLEALVVMSAAVARQPELGLPAETARERASAFNRARLNDMEALASGRGEIPAIVLRSGRASASNTALMQGFYAWYVGVAYLRGAIADRDPVAATMWFERGAQKGFSPAQVMWARALRDGSGVSADPVSAHGWFALAAKQGHPLAVTELARLEQALDADQLAQARSRPLPQTPP